MPPRRLQRLLLLRRHYSSQQDSLTAALADVHDSLGQFRKGAAATAGHFKDLQVQMNASLAQVEQKMIMQAQQLAAGELQLVQQQARLTHQEAELHESQTAFQERVTAYSQMHSRLNGATSGRFSFAAGAANPTPVDSLVNPLWIPECALPSTPHIQAVEDVLARDLRIVTLPLGIPNTRSCALQPCKVQVIINEIFDVQPKAESQMWPVVRSANRHAELGAVPVTPPIHLSSLQSPGEFHTARSHLLAHEVVPVASSSSPSSTSSWSSSSCDSLMAGGHHKVVSDRSASGQSESSCSVREPSSVDMRHEVPSVSLVRPQVMCTPEELTGPAVKGASTAQESSKRTTTMSRRQVTPSPNPLGLSSAGVCSTSNDDCNRGTAKRGGVKRSPACKTPGTHSTNENRKPSAGDRPPKQ